MRPDPDVFHKQFSLGIIVYLVMAILGINKAAPLSQGKRIVCIVTGLLFLGAVITGRVLSAAKTMPAFVRTLHKVLPALTALPTANTLYLLLHNK